MSPIQRRDGRVAAQGRAFSNPTITVAAELVVNLALLAVVSLLASLLAFRLRAPRCEDEG